MKPVCKELKRELPEDNEARGQKDDKYKRCTLIGKGVMSNF